MSNTSGPNADATALLEMERMLLAVLHDLRAPLVSIQGYTAGLKASAQRGDWNQLQADCDTIDRICNRMRQLLNELSAWQTAGTAAPVMEQVCLQEILVAALEQTPFGQSLSHLIAVPAERYSILGSPVPLVQLFQNLFMNAYSAILNHPQPAVSLKIRREQNWLVIELSNNGRGVDPQQIPLLTQPHRQLGGRDTDWGLGLSIADRIVRQHGGEMQLISEGTDQGLRAIVRLPSLTLSERSQALPQSPSEPSRPAESGGAVPLGDQNSPCTAS